MAEPASSPPPLPARRARGAAGSMWGSDLSVHARCPMCSRQVTRLRPRFFTPTGEGVRLARSLLLYNLGASLSRPLQVAEQLLSGVRSALTTFTLSAYLAGGSVWVVARDELRSSFCRVPRPNDLRLRLGSRWFVAAHLLRSLRLIRPAEREAFDFFLHHIRPIMMSALCLYRDARHARILLPSALCDGLVSGCRRLQAAASLCRVSRSATSIAYSANAVPRRIHAYMPLLLRLLEAGALLLDLGALVMHARLEVAGVRGLLMLVAWCDRHRPLELRKLIPFEGGPLGSLRFCRVEQVDVSRHRLLVGARTVPWHEALDEFGLALRALRAFHGEGGAFSTFPPWAMDDVRLLWAELPPPKGLPAGLAPFFPAFPDTVVQSYV